MSRSASGARPSSGCNGTPRSPPGATFPGSTTRGTTSSTGCDGCSPTDGLASFNDCAAEHDGLRLGRRERPRWAALDRDPLGEPSLLQPAAEAAVRAGGRGGGGAGAAGPGGGGG